MIKKVYLNDFINEFEKFNRRESFTHEGLVALYEYLEELEDDIGESIELDVIGLCSDFTEYENLEEFNHYHNLECNSIEEINEYTQVINIDDVSLIIQDF